MRKTHKWILFIAGGIALMAIFQFVRPFFSAEERRARTELREAILAQYPDTVKTLEENFGLKPLAPQKRPHAGRASKATVVLVHGLDDPGMVWMNLAPHLLREGFSVWILTYPNDQPVDASARFFLAHLQASELAKAKAIAIVAHSMGGLVSREMLTDPELAYGAKVNGGELPRVEQLIMVGTPNHGSQMVRLRGFTEFRDHLVYLLRDDYHWLMGIVDGTGEAGIDLLPGSEFLHRLNRRPHPANVRMLVVAGMMSPKTKKEILALARGLEEKLPAAARDAAHKLTEGLIAMTEQIGDGLVAVDSARLDGVPLITVQGTHRSMIRNLTAGSQRMPPAMPIIVEQLNSPPAAAKLHPAAP